MTAPVPLVGSTSTSSSNTGMRRPIGQRAASGCTVFGSVRCVFLGVFIAFCSVSFIWFGVVGVFGVFDVFGVFGVFYLIWCIRCIFFDLVCLVYLIYFV